MKNIVQSFYKKLTKLLRCKILFIQLLSLNLFLSAQVTDPIRITPDQPKNDTSLMLEKAYIHTDRLNYSSGEDIWYKAYLVNAEDNCFTSHSNNLYVELVSPKNEIIQRQNIHIFEGKGNGDFHLNEDLLSGTYYLRAYTNWMRNFEESIYYKPLNIVSIETDQTIANDPQASYYQADVDLQFFPESGSLINQVNTKIGFKAINPEGLGIDVSGFIINSLNDTLTSFQSTHLGMGKFSFKPNYKLDYFAVGSTSDGFIFKTLLPKTIDLGINLNVIEIYEDQIILSINTNSEGLSFFQDKPLILKNSCNKFESHTAINLKFLSDTLILPIYKFPTGITKLCLMDANNIPLAERILFIPKHQDLLIKIETDSQIYNPRSKVNVELKMMGVDEGKINANLSLTAVDQSLQSHDNMYASNIASYFLIESEVKGNIEQPGSYFDIDNQIRLENLDLLLMTQAWRDFKWKYASDTVLSLKFPVENNYSLVERLRIYIDSNINPPPDIKPRSYLKQKISKAIIEDIREDAFYKSMIKTRYGLNDTIVLDEFVKTGNPIIKEPKDNHFRIHREPRRSGIIKMTGNEKGYSDVIDFLRGRIAGLTIRGQFPRYSVQMRMLDAVSWSLDGMPTDMEMIMDFPVEEIDKIEVLKGAEAAIFGLNAGVGRICILSKRASSELNRLDDAKASKKKLGKYDYFKQRKFYSPKYETSTDINKAPDYRTTIHWEPYIYTDENNKANISFNNSDRSTTIEIRAEGLTESGIPIIGRAIYKVK